MPKVFYFDLIITFLYIIQEANQDTHPNPVFHTLFFRMYTTTSKNTNHPKRISNLSVQSLCSNLVISCFELRTTEENPRYSLKVVFKVREDSSKIKKNKNIGQILCFNK